MQADHGPHGDRGGGYGTANRKEKLRSEGDGRAWRARRSHGAARHGELPSSMRRSRQEQRDAGPTRNTGLTAGSVRFRRRVQAGGRWCGSRAEAAHRRCDQARRSYRRLRGCADRVSAAHAREQRRLSP
jgi:hypothetical protein